MKVFSHFFKKLFIVIIFQFLFFSGCSSLQTPDYIGPGEAQYHFSRKTSTPSNSSQNINHNFFSIEWPVQKPIYLNQKFKSGPKRVRHQGIDLGGQKGTPILSAHNGYILYAGRDFNGFGKMIILENSQGYATFYAHLDRILVAEGQIIKSGEKIGTMGRTGRATGVHLHFELRINKKAVDPIPYLPHIREPAKIKN